MNKSKRDEELGILCQRVEETTKNRLRTELKEKIKKINLNIKYETYMAIINSLTKIDICPKCGDRLRYIIKEKEDINDSNELIRNSVRYSTDFFLENIFTKNKEEKPFYICYKCKDIYNNRFININDYYEDYWQDYEESNKIKDMSSKEFLENIDKHLKMM